MFSPLLRRIQTPVPGTVKTRLEPALGPGGAAALQARLIALTLETACSAGVGYVWFKRIPWDRIG